MRKLLDWLFGNSALPAGEDAKAQEADLIVYQGRIVKNRWGHTGSTNVPIPDGFYRLLRIEDVK